MYIHACIYSLTNSVILGNYHLSHTDQNNGDPTDDNIKGCFFLNENILTAIQLQILYVVLAMASKHWFWHWLGVDNPYCSQVAPDIAT